jgi:iron complex transport system substrate-binding protein
VTLSRYPQRIVSLAPGNTEILFALGLGERIVGVTEYDDYPPEVSQIAKIGGFSTPDLEKVVALAPDLIVAASIHEARVVPELERRGLPVLALVPKSLEELLEAVTLAGRATGEVKEAERVVKELSDRIEAVRQLTAGLSPGERPKVFYIVWHDPLMTAGSDTWLEQLITIAGGVNLFHELMEYPRVDLEVVLQKDPQVIIANTGHGASRELAFQWASTEPRLKGTEALQRGRVYLIDADLVNRPGPRLVSGLEEMLRLIHPDLARKR